MNKYVELIDLDNTLDLIENAFAYDIDKVMSSTEIDRNILSLLK
jgi:hypothetical protein